MEPMYKLGKSLRVLQCLLAVAVLLVAGFTRGAEEPRPGEALLRATYLRNLARLETNSFGLPLFLDSFELADRVHVDVYGIFDHPFSSVVDLLKVPANWCDIVSLNPNVKVCTYRAVPGAWLLTFYVGGKGYQPPEETRQVIYHYRDAVQQQGYLDLLLSADAGPFATKDHRMRFEALPLDGERTFVHVSYEYSDSVAMRLAAKVYFATLARSKVGFTVLGMESNGEPVYIGGPRGSLERNAVRYYFAIQSFLDTLGYPEKTRFSMRISAWYDLAARYRRQLFDLDREDYLTFKTKDHENQIMLQQRLETELP